jgi:hypothetical protein
MLKSVDLSYPPFCDRPDVEQAGGIRSLKRVKLPLELAIELDKSVRSYLDGNFDWLTQYIHNSKRRYGWTEQQTLTSLRTSVEKKHALPLNLTANELQPTIDLDLDGTPDRIVIWRPDGREFCGETTPNRPFTPYPVSRYAIVIDEEGHLDLERTRKFFDRSDENARDMDARSAGSSHGRQYRAARPLTTSISFTEYRGRYYFDGFLEGADKSFRKERSGKNPTDMLLVYSIEKGNMPKPVCEIFWKR